MNGIRGLQRSLPSAMTMCPGRHVTWPTRQFPLDLFGSLVPYEVSSWIGGMV